MLPWIAKTALAVGGVSLLAGCVILPSPHHEMLTPAIDGTVRRSGQPVAGAQLYVENGEHCTYQGKPLAQSDATGVFHIPERQVMAYLLVMAMDLPPGRAGWRLCIVDGEQRYEGWYEELGMYDDRISLDCDLESAPQAWGWRSMYGDTYRVGGICRSPKDEASGTLKPLPAAPAADKPEAR